MNIDRLGEQFRLFTNKLKRPFQASLAALLLLSAATPAYGEAPDCNLVVNEGRYLRLEGLTTRNGEGTQLKVSQVDVFPNGATLFLENSLTGDTARILLPSATNPTRIISLNNEPLDATTKYGVNLIFADQVQESMSVTPTEGCSSRKI